MVSRRCRDCDDEGITSRRKAPYPGPRCSSHNRSKKKRKQNLDRARRLEQVYGITIDEYQDIWDYQMARNAELGLPGACAICGYAGRANSRKALSTDHDHASGYVRGLCCGPCNRYVLGHLRDDPAALQRAIDYLANPPAFDVIGKRIVPFDEEEE